MTTLSPAITELIQLKEAAITFKLENRDFQKLLGMDFYLKMLGMGKEILDALPLVKKIWFGVLYFQDPDAPGLNQERLDQAVAAVQKWSSDEFLKVQFLLPFEVQARVLRNWKQENRKIRPTFVDVLAQAFRESAAPQAIFSKPDISHKGEQLKRDSKAQIEGWQTELKTYMDAVAKDPKNAKNIPKPSFFGEVEKMRSEFKQRPRRERKPFVRSDKILTEAELANQRSKREEAIVQRHQGNQGTLIDASQVDQMAHKLRHDQDQLIDNINESLSQVQHQWQQDSVAQALQQQFQTWQKTPVQQNTDPASNATTPKAPIPESTRTASKDPAPQKSSAYNSDNVIRKAKQAQTSQTKAKVDDKDIGRSSGSTINIDN